MIKDYIIEVLLLAIVAALAFGFFNPYFMPMGMVAFALCILVALFAAFAALMWREKGADEREEQIIHKADRIGFLAGASVLIVSVVYDTVTTHHINEWVIGALFAMLFFKVASSIYYNLK